MPIRIITPPTEEPVSLVEAKAHLREDSSDHDAEIGMLIAAARTHVEDITGRYWALQTLETTFDAFPLCAINLPGPVISIDSLVYLDSNRDEQTIDSATYTVDAKGRVSLAAGASWPSTAWDLNAVRVQFTVGYEDPAEVPAPIKAAILLLVGHWYANKEAVVIGKTAVEAPMSVKALIAPYRDWAV